MFSPDFDENLIRRGSIYDHFPGSVLAWEAVWDRLFRKEFATWGLKFGRYLWKFVRIGPRTRKTGIGYCKVDRRGSVDVMEWV